MYVAVLVVLLLATASAVGTTIDKSRELYAFSLLTRRSLFCDSEVGGADAATSGVADDGNGGDDLAVAVVVVVVVTVVVAVVVVAVVVNVSEASS